MRPTEDEKNAFLKTNLPATELFKSKEYLKEVNKVWTRFRGNHKMETKKLLKEYLSKEPPVAKLPNTEIATRFINYVRNKSIQEVHHREVELCNEEVIEILKDPSANSETVPSGDSVDATNGHYTSYVLHDKWYWCDDTTITLQDFITENWYFPDLVLYEKVKWYKL